MRSITKSNFSADLFCHEGGWWQVTIYRHGATVQEIGFADFDSANRYLDKLIEVRLWTDYGSDRWPPFNG